MRSSLCEEDLPIVVNDTQKSSEVSLWVNGEIDNQSNYNYSFLDMLGFNGKLW